MSILEEQNRTSESQMASALKQGYTQLSANETITLEKYVRFILPLDGYVFWIKASQLVYPYPPGTQTVTNAPNTITVQGSFHYSSTQVQKSDNSTGIQDVILTTDYELVDFDTLQPSEMYIGLYASFRFGFSKQGNYYQQSNLWHLRGQAIYPYMETQIVDDLSTFDTSSVIVSNSLPIWLAMNAYAPVYPSFLVPENLTPPYIVAMIEPSETKSLQPIPWVNTEGIWQLAKDKVHLIIYGMRNEEVQNYVQYIIQQSLYPGLFGILQAGFSVQDEKVLQSELNVIAEQKRITLDISYNQHSLYLYAIKYIQDVLPVEVSINPFPAGE